MAAQLEISESRVGSVVVLRLKGRLIADEEDILFTERVNTLIGEGLVSLVVNLSSVTILDSGGVGTLVAKYLSVKRRGGDMRLARITERTRRVLEITRLLQVFPTFASEDEAVASFASEAALA